MVHLHPQCCCGCGTWFKICNTIDRENTTEGAERRITPAREGSMCTKKPKVKRQTFATDTKRGTRCLDGGTSKTKFNDGGKHDGLPGKVCLYLLIPTSVAFVALGMFFSRCQSAREHSSIPGGFVTQRKQRRKQQVQSSALQFCARWIEALSMNERRAVVRLWHPLLQKERENEKAG